MKNQELFHKTIGILVNAYLKNTLQHLNCSACAVGNLVAANCGFTFENLQWLDDGAEPTYFAGWPAVFSTDNKRQKFEIERYDYIKNAKKQIDSTGYTPHQLAEIEFAFESAYQYGKDPESEMYNGLMCVVDALMKIHEANESEIKQAKDLFVKELAV